MSVVNQEILERAKKVHAQSVLKKQDKEKYKEEEMVTSMRKTVDVPVEKLFVDNGYRGNNFREKGKVYTPHTRTSLSKDDKQMQKRRSATEPIIGNLKNFCRMGRNYFERQNRRYYQSNNLCDWLESALHC